MAVSNSYKTYTPTARPSPTVRSCTGPRRSTTRRRRRPAPRITRRRWSTRRPFRQRTTRPNTVTPAPWVPFTRAGCSVGNFSTANMVLENVGLDIPTVFGASSPEAQQLAADPSSFKDPETADYVGVAIHCAQGDAVCANAQAVKFGQTTATPSAVADQLPDEPGGYNGYQALFGHRYVAPQLGAGTPDLQPQRVRRDQRGRQPGRPRRSRAVQLLRQPARLPRLQPAGQRVARLHRRHAGGRDPGHLRLHLRPARAQAGYHRLHDGGCQLRRSPSARATPAT